jgi:hypothetical protein
MTQHTRSFITGLFLSTATIALTNQPAAAQNIDKFVVSGAAAKKSMTREISADTAAKIRQACMDFAKEHNVAVAVFILNPTGQIVHAREYGGGQCSSADAMGALGRFSYIRWIADYGGRSDDKGHWSGRVEHGRGVRARCADKGSWTATGAGSRDSACWPGWRCADSAVIP